MQRVADYIPAETDAAWAARQDLERPIDFALPAMAGGDVDTAMAVYQARYHALVLRVEAEGYHWTGATLRYADVPVAQRAIHALFPWRRPQYLTAESVAWAPDAELRALRGLGPIGFADIRRVIPYGRTWED